MRHTENQPHPPQEIQPMTKQRNLEVQTPGQIAGVDDAQMGADESKTTEAEAPKAKATVDRPSRARYAQMGADESKTTEAEAPKAKATVDRPSRARYAQMGADEIDAKTLTAAVLTKDGWLAPDQTGQKGKE